MRSGRRHRLRRGLIAIALIFAVFLTLTAVLFVFPSTNAPRRSNAIVVLGGSGPRLQKGLALARAGYAPNLVLSGYTRHTCPAGPRDVKIICFNPHPDTTQGEARRVTNLARSHDWHQIIVVPGTPQTTRARIRFMRCYRGTLLFDPASPGNLGEWVHNVAYEWGALIKALTLQRGC
jgi:uncharacterized SAM-binding protein YcdF (DUF218 family)